MTTGLFFHATNMKYTGTPVRIITTPIPGYFQRDYQLCTQYCVPTCFFGLCNHRNNGDEDETLLPKSSASLKVKLDSRSYFRLKQFSVAIFILVATVHFTRRLDAKKLNLYRDGKEDNAIEWLMRERRQVLRQICSSLKEV